MAVQGPERFPGRVAPSAPRTCAGALPPRFEQRVKLWGQRTRRCPGRRARGSGPSDRPCPAGRPPGRGAAAVRTLAGCRRPHAPRRSSSCPTGPLRASATTAPVPRPRAAARRQASRPADVAVVPDGARVGRGGAPRRARRRCAARPHVRRDRRRPARPDPRGHPPRDRPASCPGSPSCCAATGAATVPTAVLSRGLAGVTRRRRARRQPARLAGRRARRVSTCCSRSSATCSTSWREAITDDRARRRTAPRPAVSRGTCE